MYIISILHIVKLYITFTHLQSWSDPHHHHYYYHQSYYCGGHCWIGRSVPLNGRSVPNAKLLVIESSRSYVVEWKLHKH